MIPEIEVTCRGERLFINSVTVEQYKKYISLMEKNDTEKFSGVMFFNKKIMQEMFGNELSLAAVGEIDAVEFLTAIKTVHFIMQNIVAEKMLSIVEVEQVEKRHPHSMTTTVKTDMRTRMNNRRKINGKSAGKLLTVL